MFLLHTLQNLPLTFGAVANVLLSKLCDMAEQVHLVCDTYVNPSINEIERDKRGAEETIFSITGAEQRRPKEWQQALLSASFKISSFVFLQKNRELSSIQIFCWTIKFFLAMMTNVLPFQKKMVKSCMKWYQTYSVNMRRQTLE